MTVEVRAIELPRDTARFVKAWWPIYADDPHWVPPLIFERKQFFNPDKNPYFRLADVQCFIAYRDGRPVGTIAATEDHKYREHNEDTGFFGFFEFTNDLAVAQALIDAAADWLRRRGIVAMHGPFNFNTNHEFGLLIDGFDTDPCLLNPHNRDYYGAIYEQLGMVKAMDWFAYWIDLGPPSPFLYSISERFLSRHPEITIRNVDLNEYDRDVTFLYEIYNDAWQENWGHVDLSEAEFRYLAGNLKDLIDPELCYIAEVNGQPAALSVSLPDLNQVAKKMNGRVLPFGWYHWLTGRGKVDSMRIFILGVKKEYQRWPLGAPLYLKTWEEGARRKYRGAEASLILENNYRMRGALEKMGFHIYKTYRTYEYPVTPSEPAG